MKKKKVRLSKKQKARLEAGEQMAIKPEKQHTQEETEKLEPVVNAHIWGKL